MHNQNIKPNILCLASDDFNNSLEELKDFLDFNLLFSKNLQKDISIIDFKAVLFDIQFTDKLSLKIIDNLKDKGKILISTSGKNKNISYDEKVDLPINILDLNKKIVNVISSKIFNKNSAIRVKEYTLDKNEKKLKKENNFIIVTEKEINLIELLFHNKVSIPKKKILEVVWQYAADADTHTVETHIYRLRNKIEKKFNDNNFIINTKEGYKI
jgi:DNA-binding response OmpR family regulator|tara:strand:+ start:458 stop:1096 length:639 start_codon:yes stop_codon:yes gene_type:complete